MIKFSLFLFLRKITARSLNKTTDTISVSIKKKIFIVRTLTVVDLLK